MEVIHTDVLVIGGGLAGQRAAIGARRRGLQTIVLSLVPAKRSHSAAAQGGMQASLGNCAGAAGDNEDIHFADTVRGSDWGADQQVVRMFTHTAPKAIRELACWGVPWNRVASGDNPVMVDGSSRVMRERDDAHGLITSRNFGGTAKWRACYVSDGTGHAMLYALSNQAVAAGIPVHERMEALALICDGDRCVGAVVRNLVTGALLAYAARAVCIATGGFGRIYRVSTNAIINEGMGAAIALETGIAQLGNMEAVQFHPTGIFPAGILVTEGCRGDGGLLLDGKERRFMPDYEPDKKELASRDVVSRAMERHIAAGHGASTRYGDHLWLDIRLLGSAHIDARLREVAEICRYFLGIDPVRQLIPVRPAQHYSMGGVRTDCSGQSPQLQGLFAAGEAACWDLHGFNRLGGNSVAETVVAGMIVGESIADYCDATANQAGASATLLREACRKQEQSLEKIAACRGDEQVFDLTAQMQDTMTGKVGIFRDGEQLEGAVEALRELHRRAQNIRLRSSAPGANPELVAAYRLRRMLKLAQCVALGALARTESRGAHYRADYPQRNDRDWLKRTLCSWSDAGADRPELDYEALDVMSMEMPPGWRGYGAKDFIPHPDAAQRQQAVDAAASAARSGAQQDGREPLLPFRHLLPPYLRGPNQRLEEEQ
ncbi:MAG: fumarate reductase flavoprotein subunit [Halioglobus sp.]|nr:fumarate reductase flavoprotein subunit [Halioglobus sp.]